MCNSSVNEGKGASIFKLLGMIKTLLFIPWAAKKPYLAFMLITRPSPFTRPFLLVVFDQFLVARIHSKLIIIIYTQINETKKRGDSFIKNGNRANHPDNSNVIMDVTMAIVLTTTARKAMRRIRRCSSLSDSIIFPAIFDEKNF
uniref:Uncharacterized protein n=1 Tax=Romanomermis culicivorax TaxID=13658 RepID=A0A915J783_ROMCU